MSVTPVPRSTPGCQTVSEAQCRWFSETQDNGLLREASHPTVLQPLIATVAPTKGAAMLTSVALLHWLTVHTPQLQLEKWHNTYSFSWQSPGSNRSWRALQSLWNDIIHTWGTSQSTTVIWCKAFLYVKILKHQALSSTWSKKYRVCSFSLTLTFSSVSLVDWYVKNPKYVYKANTSKYKGNT